MDASDEPSKQMRIIASNEWLVMLEEGVELHSHEVVS